MTPHLLVSKVIMSMTSQKLAAEFKCIQRLSSFKMGKSTYLHDIETKQYFE